MTRLDSVQDGCWVNLTYPSEDELNTVAVTLGVEPSFLRGVVGLHIAVLLIVALGLQQVVEGQLGGLDVELELLDVVLHVAGVDAEEHVALVDGLPLLKGGLQDLAADQRGHLVGLDGLDGAGGGTRRSFSSSCRR